MPAGGKRPGAGSKPGPRGLYKPGLEKSLAREELRKYVIRHLPAMLRSQVAAAQGIGHLYTRDKNGKFSRIENVAQIDKLLAEGVENSDYYIFAKDPSTHAFLAIVDHALDKAPQHDTVDLTVKEDFEVKLAARRQRLHAQRTSQP